MFSLTSIIDLASSEGCLWRLVDRLSFKFGFPNWIQTQENILKPRILLTDLVDGSYELFTSGHVVFRQLENTALIIKNEYKLKINLPSRRFWQPPHGFETRFVKTLFFWSLLIDAYWRNTKSKGHKNLCHWTYNCSYFLTEFVKIFVLNLATPPKSLH